jgi:hypothetical protein
MGPHPVWIVGNAVAVQATVITMSYLFYLDVLTRGWRWPWTSTAIITVTALVTGLSFAVPDLLALLRRDTDSLLAGQVWRVITPLFVQPHGLRHGRRRRAVRTGLAEPAERRKCRGVVDR